VSRALDREEAALSEWLRHRVNGALADPRADAAAREVFRRLREHHAERAKAKGDEELRDTIEG
jgi:antitoxin ParD1/3/4